MAKLYLANCTRQRLDFLYRVPDENGAMLRRVHTQTIEPGTQQLIFAEAPQHVLEAIVAQHRKYGLIAVEDVPNTDKTEFIGMCFQFNRPVDLDRLNHAFDHNQGVLHQEGMDRRAEAAIVIDSAINQQLDGVRRQGAHNVPNLTDLRVETLEEADNPSFAEGIRIDRTQQAPDRERRSFLRIA